MCLDLLSGPHNRICLHFMYIFIYHGIQLQQLIVSSSVVCMLNCLHSLMLVHVHIWRLKICSQLISLSIKRHGIHIHVNVAGFTAAHPTDGSAVEGRPASCIVLVHHRRLWIQFGGRFWHLKFHELVGFFKAAVGHGAPGKTEVR